MKELKITYLHTGTNMGNQLENLQKVNQLIELYIGKIQQQSGIYETEAWGVENQPNFLNQALKVQTALSPYEVLEKIYWIEQAIFNRVREERWAERIIDVDILFYESCIIENLKLTIPHPQIQYRNFVLIPMMDIAPYFEHPILKDTIENIYLTCRDELDVILTDYQPNLCEIHF